MWSGKDAEGGVGRPSPAPGDRSPPPGCPCARIVPMRLSPTKRKDIPFLKVSAIALLKTSDPFPAAVRAPIGESCLSNLMENCGITLTDARSNRVAETLKLHLRFSKATALWALRIEAGSLQFRVTAATALGHFRMRRLAVDL